jgi:hypothetical protein
LHITYRVVAARASGLPLSTEASNRYWTAKALAFVRTHPLAALNLTARKIAAAVSSHDAWDLVTMVRKERELSAIAIPFGYLFAVAIVGLWFGDRDRLAPAAIAMACALAPMFVFYVTARQRNAVIPAAAILAGAAVAAAFRRRRVALIVGIAIVAGAFLTLETDASSEDRHMWAPATRPAMLFDEALRLEQAHQWAQAETLLRHLDDVGYRPLRRNTTASSISYHIARAMLRQRKSDRVATLLERARAEAPGDPDVLALSCAVLATTHCAFERELVLLHDPFTAELSRLRAAIDAGKISDARTHLVRLTRAIPEWKRPLSVARAW